MPFTGREKVLCVGACSITVEQDYAACICEFSKQSPTAMQIWTWHKKFIQEGCLCMRKGSG